MAFQLQYSSELNLEGAVHMPTCMQQRGDGIVGLLYKAGCPFCRRNVALQGRHYSMASTAGMHQQLCRCPARAACQPCVRAGSLLHIPAGYQQSQTYTTQEPLRSDHLPKDLGCLLTIQLFMMMITMQADTIHVLSTAAGHQPCNA